MLLRHSQTSPYSRKITVLLHEIGLINDVRIEDCDPWDEPEELVRDNPLSAVPTLVLSDERALFDSHVICEYLDRQHVGRPMIPHTGDPHCQTLRDEALADGIMACAELIYVEREKRPEGLRWDRWLDLKRRSIDRALDRLEEHVPVLGNRVDLGTISVAVALGYVDSLSLEEDWRERCPALAAWYGEFSQRPSMVATAPGA